MKRGRIISDRPPLRDTAAYAREQLLSLAPEYKRFENAHEYKVGISENLLLLRDRLMRKHRENLGEAPRV